MQYTLSHFYEGTRSLAGWCRLSPNAASKGARQDARLPSSAASAPPERPHVLRLRKPAPIEPVESLFFPSVRSTDDSKDSAPSGDARRNVSAARPVRVLTARDGTGERLVLVGRMIDVCAELDRLALGELVCD